MRSNFRHRVCSGWNKYYIYSNIKNIAIFISDRINSIEFVFFKEEILWNFFYKLIEGGNRHIIASIQFFKDDSITMF